MGFFTGAGQSFRNVRRLPQLREKWLYAFVIRLNTMKLMIDAPIAMPTEASGWSVRMYPAVQHISRANAMLATVSSTLVIPGSRFMGQQ